MTVLGVSIISTQVGPMSKLNVLAASSTTRLKIALVTVDWLARPSLLDNRPSLVACISYILYINLIYTTVSLFNQGLPVPETNRTTLASCLITSSLFTS